MKIKKIIAVSVLLIISAFLSALIYQPQIVNAELAEVKSTMHFSVGLNKTGTDDFNTKYANKTSEKFGKSFKDFDNSKTKAELTLRFTDAQEDITERRAEVTGSIFIDTRAFGFKGNGVFEPFVTPDTNETLYLGNIEGELLGVKMSSEEPKYQEYSGNNSHWFVVFNPDTKQMHIAVGVGFQEHTGILFFGDNMMNKERWEAYETQLNQRYQSTNINGEVGQ